MDTISTTELVRKIGHYAHQVCYAGRSFLVTANGRPMFKIVPPYPVGQMGPGPNVPTFGKGDAT